MMVPGRCTAAVLCIVVTGCAVTADYQPPAVDLPVRWSGESRAGSPVVTADLAWWRTFGDGELDSLIERALSANLDLQLAGARLRESRARGGSTASSWPSLNASASFARERDSENAPSPVVVRPDGEVERPGRAENLFQTGFDASWELDLFGGTRRSLEASQADYQSVLFDRGAVVLTLIAELCRNYLELRGAQQQRRIAQQSIVAQRESLVLLQSRSAAGMATGIDVARAQAQLQATAAKLPPLDAACQRSLNRLSVLSGQPPGALSAELSAQRPLPVPGLPPPLGLPSDLLRQRPDIRSAERRVAAASARLGAATAELYPKFTLLGKVGLASETVADFFNPASGLWSIGPSISWPILQRGRVKAVIEVREARQQQALIQYRRAILNGIEDVENAITAYRHEQDQRVTLAQAVASEELALQLARERYAGGLTDFREVVAGEQSLLQAQSDLARSETALLLDLVALYKALGGGWKGGGGE